MAVRCRLWPSARLPLPPRPLKRMHTFSGRQLLRSLATFESVHHQSAASPLAPSSGAHVHAHSIAPRSDPGRPAGLMIATLSRLITHGRLCGPCIISVLSGPCGSTPPDTRDGAGPPTAAARIASALPRFPLRVRPMNHETPKTPRRRRVRARRRRRRRTRRPAVSAEYTGHSAASNSEAWSRPAHQ